MRLLAVSGDSGEPFMGVPVGPYPRPGSPGDAVALG